jgi:hypothetical protein
VLIWRFIEFLRSKNSPAKYRHKSGIKIVFFLKNEPKPIQAGHLEDIFTHSISAKPQL